MSHRDTTGCSQASYFLSIFPSRLVIVDRWNFPDKEREQTSSGVEWSRVMGFTCASILTRAVWKSLLSPTRPLIHISHQHPFAIVTMPPDIHTQSTARPNPTVSSMSTFLAPSQQSAVCPHMLQMLQTSLPPPNHPPHGPPPPPCFMPRCQPAHYCSLDQ